MTSTALSTETWELIGTLFDQLAALPPNERDLDTLDQPQSVRTLLEQMLAAHDTADPQLLDRTVRAVAGGLLQDEAVPTPVDYTGRGFGPWRTGEEIGRGGMAVVLRGERADGQFEKKVAIKLLPHTGAGAGRERLLEEIRILARLEHPNIARLIDGGISEDDIPYLVMEYVHGVPITEYCDEQKLDTKARVRLLMQVVEAVLFAHRHLIVHCDIKPGNILVNEDGQAKLVDFGIAGLISAPDESAPRGLFCSPAYCAPEQMQGASPDTAQDTFSLGAVLYELLCGRRIRDNKTATRMLFNAAATGPVTPPSKGIRGVDRDLDAICMKALATEPGDRYASANTLLTELKHWQNAEPVAAREGGAGYRLGKWLLRYWLPAAAAGIAAMALVTGAGVALWQARQAGTQAEIATQESRRAASARDFLVGLFEGTGPDQRQGREVTAVELLDQGARTLLEGDAEAPELQADLFVTLAGIYREMGQFEQAGHLLAAARKTGYDPVTTGIETGRLAHAEARYESAETAFRESMTRVDATRQPRLRAEILSLLAKTLAAWGREDEAEDAVREALALDREAGTPEPLALARDHSVAADIAYARGDLEQAEADIRQALELRRAALGDTHTLVATAQHDLGVTLLRRGAAEEAENFFNQALATRRQLLGDHHADTAATLFNLGVLKRREGDLDAAQANYRAAVEVLRTLFPDGHPELAGVLNSMALAAREQGDTASAITYMQEAIDSARASAGDSHPLVATFLGNLAHLHRAQGELTRAESIQREAIEILREAVGEDHHLYGVGLNGLAAIERELGREQTALEHFDQAAGIIATTRGEQHPDYAGILMGRAELALAMGLTEQAIRDARTARDIVEQALPENHPLRERARTVVESMPGE